MFASNDKLAQIAKLIEQAEHFRRHGEEGSAEAALARADAMMKKYQIDQAVLEMQKPAEQRTMPTSIDFDFVPASNPWYGPLSTMLKGISKSARVRIAIRPSYSSASKIFMVGFEKDVEYARMIWNNVYFAFVSKLDPTWDTARTADENIKILKEAGRKWGWIAEQATAHGFECTPNDGRLKAAYRRQCKAEGVEPTSHTQRHEAYRHAYAQSFAATIDARLRRQRLATEEATEQSGKALVVADRYSEVDARFYEMFPNLRPWTDEQWAEFEAKTAKQREQEQAAYEKMTPTQRAAYDRKRAREDAQAQARWEREHARTQDRAGRQAGANAAAQVDLGSTKVAGNNTKGIEQ